MAACQLLVVDTLRLRTDGWSQNPEGLSIAGHPTKSPAVAPLRDRVPRPMVPTGVSHECLSFPCDISTNPHLREEELLAEGRPIKGLPIHGDLHETEVIRLDL